ncbi:MAG: NTP transferase domain-containing protein [Candidatus Margulisbacteria bacterium]|nr:NTP transferase domain-containing protein [Candidatus Margulisiibacteriota bacterium]
MKIGAIVQARMNSIRFPKKTLYKVNNKPLLFYLIENLKQCSINNDVIVATSEEESDLPVEKLCQEKNIKVFRGKLDDVAYRFIQVLEKNPWDAFIRVNGDSPLLDYRLIEKALTIYKNGDYDLVTNVFPRTFPKGQSVEIIKTTTFISAYPKFKDNFEKEHITQHFYRNKEKYKIFNFKAEHDYSNKKFAVDTPDDMKFFEATVQKMKKPHWEYNLDELVELQKEPVV